MSAQYHGSSSEGVKTYIDRNGDTVQESSGPVPIFRGLAAAGGEAFISESESSDGEYVHHNHHHSGPYVPAPSEKKSKKEKKEKKEKKSKKEKRSGSSGCNCGHSH